MFLSIPSFNIHGAKEWTLDGELLYFSAKLDRTILVPRGFETDLASIPAFFRRVLPVNDSHRLAAVVHDYLYSVSGKVPGIREISRKECDQIFMEAMKVLEVSWWKRSAMYRAVRLGGGFSWKG